MMFVNKEEVEASAGRKFIEPSVGVPIKKRPFNLNGPSFLQSDTRSLDNLSFTPKHFTPKSLLDFTSSPCSSNDNNKLDSNTEKPSDSNINSDINNSVSVVTQEKLVSSNCSTDLSLTGNCNPGSSKIQDMESLNCSGRKAALDLNVDLNVAIETWDSTADFAVVNNGVVQNKPVEEPLVKQSSGFNMECIGNIPTNLSKNIEKPIAGKGSLGDVTLDLQLKLPPRPELRMKNSDIWSSDLSLSLSSKDLGNNNNNTPKSDTLKPDQVRKENSVNNLNVKPVVQKEVTVKDEFNGNLKEKDVQENGPKDQINLASVSSVKKEPVDNNNVSHESQQLGGKLLQRTSNNGIDLNQTASCSNPVVTKSVPIGSVVHPAISQGSTIVPAGDLVAQHAVAKPNASGPVGNLVVQPSIIKSNASVPAGGSVVQPSITTSVPARVSVVQPTITKSKSNDSGNNTSSANVPTSLPLVGNSSDPSTSIIEDVKPVISSIPIPIPIPAISVNIAKQTLPMVSEGMSQGSADMDCSEENHNLPKLAASDKSKEPLVNSIQGSCSSVLSKVPKLEPGIPTEITGKEVEEKQTGNGESSKSLAPSTIPNSVELNSNHNNNENYDTVFAGDANEMPSNCPNLRQLNILSLSNKTKQSLEMEGIGLGSKSRSPSLSGKRDSSNSRRDNNNSTSDRENGLQRESGFERENCMEREFGSSGRRQFVGEGSNNSSHQFQFQRRFKRNGFDFDRPDFQRKKSRVSQWDEGTNNRPNRGRSQRWEPRRYNKFDGDMIEEHNEDMGFRPGPNNRTRPNFRYNNKNNNNRFNNNRNKSRGGGFKFTRQNSNNSDMSFPEESNRKTGPRPCLSRFQSRRRLADVSPREADEMDSPFFDHPNNNNNSHYNNNNSNNKRVVEHGVMCSRDRSFSPPARRGSRHWTPPAEMLSGHDEMVRSSPVPNRRPFYNNNKDCTNRRHLSSNNNRQLHRNNNNNTRRFVGPASGEHFEPPMHFDRDVHYHHVRYCSDDGDDVAFSDGGAPPVRGRNRANNNNNGNNNMRNQEDYRYNKRGGPPHGWRDGNNNTNSASNNNNANNNNNNNNGDKLRRRRY